LHIARETPLDVVSHKRTNHYMLCLRLKNYLNINILLNQLIRTIKRKPTNIIYQ